MIDPRDIIESGIKELGSEFDRQKALIPNADAAAAMRAILLEIGALNLKLSQLDCVLLPRNVN